MMFSSDTQKQHLDGTWGMVMLYLLGATSKTAISKDLTSVGMDFKAKLKVREQKYLQ